LALFFVAQSFEPLSAGAPEPGMISLSNATKLKDVVVRCCYESSDTEWVIMMLETITPKHRDLRRITIHIPYPSSYSGDFSLIVRVEGAKPGMRWSDLDHLLVRLLESYSIHPKVVCPRSKNITRGVKDWTRYLLPETTERGTVELVE
jgi:hypothetical protein